jgi:hypothetical protein
VGGIVVVLGYVVLDAERSKKVDRRCHPPIVTHLQDGAPNAFS